jgi:hypothetical protein
MKNIIISFYCFFFLNNFVKAQNTFDKSDDSQRISLGIYIPNQGEEIPEIAKPFLSDKIDRFITTYSISGSNRNQRFIIVPVISILNKEITSSAPSLTVISLQTSLFLGDGIEGVKFSVISFSSKGVGQNETKAYIDAIKQINIDNPKIKAFIEEGKRKIIEYYNSRCDFNLARANALSNQNNFDEAIYLLSSIPEITKDCFESSMSAIVPIFQKSIDFQCSKSLLNAKNIWNSNQDLYSASLVAKELAKIDPNSACFSDVQVFTNSIAKRVFELDKREWDFKLKQQQDGVDLSKSIINAARDIGVAYGNNQPDVVYNTTLIRSWW